MKLLTFCMIMTIVNSAIFAVLQYMGFNAVADGVRFGAIMWYSWGIGWHVGKMIREHRSKKQ